MAQNVDEIADTSVNLDVPTGATGTLAEELNRCSVFRKECKISGQIGTSKGCISFVSLARQVDTCVAKGYTDSEVVEAVIRAVHPSTGLRVYLEGREELPLKTLKGIIRSYYREKTPTELYTDLCNLSQGTREDPQDFLIRALGLRQQVMVASAGSDEDALKYSPDLVNAIFRHSVSTGFVDDSVRQQMQVTLEDATMADDLVLQKLTQIVRHEAERVQKLRGNKSRANVSSLESPEEEHRDSEIKKLTAQRKSDSDKMVAMQKEIEELRQVVQSQAKLQCNKPPRSSTSHERAAVQQTFSEQYRPRQKPGCPRCRESGSQDQCKHCWRCGCEEHFKAGCKQRRPTQPDQNTRNMALQELRGVVCQLTSRQKRNMVELIGEKCILSCRLGGVAVEALWDTGAQVCMIPEAFLRRKFRNPDIWSLQELLDGELTVSSASGTDIPFVGWIALEFRLNPQKQGIMVPFLVCNHPEVKQTIIGYNVIQQFNRDSVENDLPAAAKGIHPDDVKVVVNLLHTNEQFCPVRVGRQDVVIPKGGVIPLRCTVHPQALEQKSALVVPEIERGWLNGVAIQETLVMVPTGSACHVKVLAENTTDHDVTISRHTKIGTLQPVKSVTPVPFSEAKLPSNPREGREVKAQQWDPPVDLEGSGLNENQIREVKALLREECDAFAQGDEVGSVPDLVMKIDLKDDIPVQRNYISIPPPLQQEVKEYLADLLRRGWIRRSTSNYSSPVVCVRRKDGALRLCIDYRQVNLKTCSPRQPIPKIQDALNLLKGKTGSHGSHYWIRVKPTIKVSWLKSAKRPLHSLHHGGCWSGFVFLLG